VSAREPAEVFEQAQQPQVLPGRLMLRVERSRVPEPVFEPGPEREPAVDEVRRVLPVRVVFEPPAWKLREKA
jgi:hypothetical protein